eukprot:1163527-Pyramimonas_sp.AAC.1
MGGQLDRNASIRIQENVATAAQALHGSIDLNGPLFLMNCRAPCQQLHNVSKKSSVQFWNGSVSGFASERK